MNSIVIIVLLVAPLFILKKVTKSINQLNGKRIKVVFVGYLAILLIALVVFYMLPGGDFTYKELSQNDINKADQAEHLRNALSKGKLNQMEGVYIKGKWNFIYEKEKLEIDSSDSKNGSWMVFVERKDTNDNKIEAVHYTTKTIINNIDLTDKINYPKVALEGKRLNFIRPEPCEVKLIKYQKEFTVTQFSKENGIENEGSFSGLLGSDVFYLQIPKDVQLTFDSNKVNVQYVDNK